MPSFHGFKYTEVSLFKGAGLHCIQRCPHFRWCWKRGNPLNTEVFSFKGAGLEIPLYTARR